MPLCVCTHMHACMHMHICMYGHSCESVALACSTECIKGQFQIPSLAFHLA